MATKKTVFSNNGLCQKAGIAGEVKHVDELHVVTSTIISTNPMPAIKSSEKPHGAEAGEPSGGCRTASG